eukprot:1229140-Rhodomonas_salina.1
MVLRMMCGTEPAYACAVCGTELAYGASSSIVSATTNSASVRLPSTIRVSSRASSHAIRASSSTFPEWATRFCEFCGISNRYAGPDSFGYGATRSRQTKTAGTICFSLPITRVLYNANP